MKLSALCTTISLLLLTSCGEQYKRTMQLPNDKLYVEVFNVNPAGVDAAYLTDSINFRLYVGQWDVEHEDFIYICKSDSIYITKLDFSTKNCQLLTLADGRKTIRCDTIIREKKVYNLANLKSAKKFD